MSKLKLVEPTQLAFSYEQLPESVALEARQAAERIRVRLRRTSEDIIMIGKDLLDTKERLPHGSFLPWIEAEFGMSDRTAQKFMAVAKSYGAKSELYSHLDPTALYELAAPKTPIEVREEIEAMIAAGEVVKRETIVELGCWLRLAGLPDRQPRDRGHVVCRELFPKRGDRAVVKAS